MYAHLIKHILLPIDFNVSTGFIIKQAIELSETTGATFHLLHVLPKQNNVLTGLVNKKKQSKKIKEQFIAAQKKILEWKQAIEETLPGISVEAEITIGAVHNIIIEKAKLIKPQLIIIGTKNTSGFFKSYRPLSANEITKITGCPVLTVMNSASNKKQLIVVPIRNFIPNKKIALLIIFARMYRAKVHLVAVQNKVGYDDAERYALLETFKLLKSCLNNTVEYHLLKGNNFAKATLQYAKEVGADMMFVNPFVETSISMITGKHINDLLLPSARLKILAVEPAVNT